MKTHPGPVSLIGANGFSSTYLVILILELMHNIRLYATYKCYSGAKYFSIVKQSS